jgi:hypothetical protein
METPFIPWSPDEIAERIAALPALARADLLDLAESLSEGIEDIPAEMQAYYHAVRAEIASRRPLQVWDYTPSKPVTAEERVIAQQNIQSLPDAELDALIESLTMEPEEGELPTDVAEDLQWMREERDARRAARQPPQGS